MKPEDPFLVFQDTVEISGIAAMHRKFLHEFRMLEGLRFSELLNLIDIDIGYPESKGKPSGPDIVIKVVVKRSTCAYEYVSISGGIDTNLGEDSPSSGLAFKENSSDRVPFHDRTSTPGMEQQTCASLCDHIV